MCDVFSPGVTTMFILLVVIPLLGLAFILGPGLLDIIAESWEDWHSSIEYFKIKTKKHGKHQKTGGGEDQNEDS